MSDPHAAPTPVAGSGGQPRRWQGWGRAIASSGRHVIVADDAELERSVLALPERGGIARGRGRSYGDQAQRGGGHALDLAPMQGIGPVAADGTVVAEAGVTIHDLLRRCVPEGWFVPVTPGTRVVSVGGAVAADIHGKNHHRDGTFCSHIVWLDLVLSDGSTVRTGPDIEPELFWATAGGLGLTGVVSRLCLRLVPIETSVVLVDTRRFDRLDHLLAAMIAADATAPYSVAWVDCLGRRRGRSVLTTGRFARSDEVDTPRRAPGGRTVSVPPLGRHSLLRASTVTAFNAAWFRAAPRHRVAEPQSIARFFHPLDGVADWPRLYGGGGFCQWQFVVPDDAVELVAAAIDELDAARVPTFLAVLKRFGPANPAPLSFPIAGWTLAVDIPARSAGVDAVLDRLDARIAEAGGRVYLAKDARLDPRLVPAMYPGLDRWRAVRDRMDPHRRFVSDMAARLHLLG
ncbi:MAG: FAD-binding protein [Acidimicrobiales bacterium]